MPPPLSGKLQQLTARRGAAVAVGRSRRPRRRRPRKTKAVGTLVEAAREGWNPTPQPLAAGRTGPGTAAAEESPRAGRRRKRIRFDSVPAWVGGWEVTIAAGRAA